jgi:hypothetical protein
MAISRGSGSHHKTGRVPAAAECPGSDALSIKRLNSAAAGRTTLVGGGPDHVADAVTIYVTMDVIITAALAPPMDA